MTCCIRRKHQLENPGIENVLEAAKIGGVDISIISNPLHDMRDKDRSQQLETVQRHNRYMAHLLEKHDSICRLVG
jgi:hypothetical protein